MAKTMLRMHGARGGRASTLMLLLLGINTEHFNELKIDCKLS